MGLTVLECRKGSFTKKDIAKILAVLQEGVYSDQRCEFGLLHRDFKQTKITIGEVVKELGEKGGCIALHQSIFQRMGLGVLIPPPFYTDPEYVHRPDHKGWDTKSENVQKIKKAKMLGLHLNREYGAGLHLLHKIVGKQCRLSPLKIKAKFWRLYGPDNLKDALSFDAPYLEALYANRKWRFTVISD